MMKNVCISLIILCGVCIPLWGFAEEQTQGEVSVVLDPVVVTATRVEIPKDQVGRSVSTVTEEEIEQQHPTSLSDSLRNQVGIRSKQLRGPGSLQTIDIRGTGARYTQILINGLPIRDVSDPQGSAIEFMSDPLVEDYARIEVVRGASSTLYGSDSIGGTINIIPQRGTEETELFGLFEGGSFSTYQGAAGFRGATELVNYSLLGKYLSSDGLDDHSEYENRAFAGTIGLNMTDNMSLTFYGKYSDAEMDLNSSPSVDVDGNVVADQDDPDDTKDATLFNGSVIFTHQVTEQFDYDLKFGYVDTERKFYFGPEEDFGYENTSTYKGNTQNFDAQANYSLNENNLFTVGYEFEAEEMEMDLTLKKEEPDAQRHSFYLQDTISLLDEQLNLAPGIRYMDHDQTGNRFDWQVSVSYTAGESGFRPHGQIGSGFRAPALYELYGAFYSSYSNSIVVIGNTDLDPEESLAWDMGVEFTNQDETFLADATYFSTDFDEMIAYGTTGYENTDGGKSQGVEIELKYAPSASLVCSGTYTYTDAETADGEDTPGISSHKFGLNIHWQALENLGTNLAITTVSERDTMVYDPNIYESKRFTEDGYVVVDLNADYEMSDSLKIW
ncbi:MAG: hypothetical protein CSA50_09175, partial [Gammaproteobacteria bacterium]